MSAEALNHLPAEATAALDEYLAGLDDALPDHVTAVAGVYLTGSAVLGDWEPSRSDLDILVVTENALSDEELAALEGLHENISGRPFRDAVYVPAASVGARDEDIAYPAAIDGVFHRARHRPEPVMWATLDRHGLTVRGPEASELNAGPDPEWLKEWNHGNLESYWRPWAADVRGMLTDREVTDPLPAYPVTWAVLGPGRLHATITSGEIISKTAAADYTSNLIPQYTKLLNRARRNRRGDDTATFTVADGREACDLIDAVADDAARLRSE